jgi:hypothetical protein
MRNCNCHLDREKIYMMEENRRNIRLAPLMFRVDCHHHYVKTPSAAFADSRT